MGRPIKDKFFGDPSGPYKQFDDIDAWIPGEVGEEKCYITQQRSDNKYRLIGKTSSGVGVCHLVDKDAGSLAEGEMMMTCTPFGGSPERVKAMSQNNVKTFAGNRYRYAKNKRAEKAGECDLSSYNGRPFVTTWRTTAPNETITLPLFGLTDEGTWFDGDGVFPPSQSAHPYHLGKFAGFSPPRYPDQWCQRYSLYRPKYPVYNFLVDWGDGNTDLITSWDQAERTHEYAVAGDHNVSIYGRMDLWSTRRAYNEVGLDKITEAGKLVDIVQWGDVQFISLNSAFASTGLTSVNTPDKPDLSKFNGSMSYMFNECYSLTSVDMRGWDTSSAPFIDFSWMFTGDLLIDSIDLRDINAKVIMANGSFWLNKTTGSTSILGLDELDFSECGGFYVPFLRSMMDDTTLRSLATIDTGSAYELSAWFETDFKAVGVDSDQSIVKSIVENWDVGNIVYLRPARRFVNLTLDLSNWDMTNVKVMFGFHAGTGSDGCTFDISGWSRTLRRVTSMRSAFDTVANLTIDLSEFRNCTKVESWRGFFNDCTVGTGNVQGIEYLRVTDSATTMYRMFRNSDVDISNVDFAQWDVRNVTDGVEFMLNGPTMTTEQYDELLIAWSQLPVQPGVTWHFGSAQYTSGGAAEAARDVLTGAPNNWIITDGGSL